MKTTGTNISNECSYTGGTVFYATDLSGHTGVYTINGVNQCRNEIFAGGRHLATYVLNGNRTTFSHADWLGTERVRSYSTTYAENCTSLPFGDALSCSQPGDPGKFGSVIHFTGKERDPESGLDNFGARYNSSSIGRWISPDVVNLTDERVQNPANTLNKYVYGGNNPLKYVDPDGRDITVFYTSGGPQGHFWLLAYDQSTGESAVLNFGPRDQTNAARAQEVLGIAVPGDTNFGSHITSPDELKQDFTSLTIQTNPEDTQKAIKEINTFNGVSHEFMTYDHNCTTVCRDIVIHKILKLNTTSMRPVSLWGDIFKKWSNAALSQQPGSKPPKVLSKPGKDYGRPRYQADTFDLAWRLLNPEKHCVTTFGPNGQGGSMPITTCEP